MNWLCAETASIANGLNRTLLGMGHVNILIHIVLMLKDSATKRSEKILIKKQTRKIGEVNESDDYS